MIPKKMIQIPLFLMNTGNETVSGKEEKDGRKQKSRLIKNCNRASVIPPIITNNLRQMMQNNTQARNCLDSLALVSAPGFLFKAPLFSLLTPKEAHANHSDWKQQ